MSKIDFESVSALTKLYEDQERIGKVEDEVARIIFDRASRDQKRANFKIEMCIDDNKINASNVKS